MAAKNFDIDIEALDAEISRIKAALHGIAFPADRAMWSGNLKRSHQHMVPLAYAMLELLVEDVDDAPESWWEFLEDALCEIVHAESCKIDAEEAIGKIKGKL